MTHDVALISTLAAGFGLALALGFVAVRLRLPALVGYLAAGIAVGPFTPGFVADASLSSQLAEIGVMLLMFGVGLHFSFSDLLAVKNIAIPGAILQILAATVLGAGLAHLWGWPLPAGIVFGLALSVASTVVLLKALEARGEVESLQGRIAVGWLVVEDLAMVLVLVLLPPLAGILSGEGNGLASAVPGLLRTLGGVALYVLLMVVVGRRLFPWFLWLVARTGSRELFTLSVVAAALGIAVGSAHLFGVSFALGAFFAGTVLGESSLSHRAGEESLPLREAFSVLFFVSVGMLFDPSVLLRDPLRVLAVLSVILVGKSVVAFALVAAFRHPPRIALTIAASLAQIGEFSFILMEMGVKLGLLPEASRSLILAGAILSIAVNPFLFRAIGPAQSWLASRRWLASRADPLATLPSAARPGSVDAHVVLACTGPGELVEAVLERLGREGTPVVVASPDRSQVETLRQGGIHAVRGSLEDPATLVQAHVARARALLVLFDEPIALAEMARTARALRPSVDLLALGPRGEEARRLEREEGYTVLSEIQMVVAEIAVRLSGDRSG